MLSQSEIHRYTRQLPIVGLNGQKQLSNASVLCVGAGGLGSSALLYLVSAGVGKIGIVDGDQVALSNLHRQILYVEADVGKAKVDCAKKHLLARNHHVSIETYEYFLTTENAESCLKHYDFVIDCTDNFKARYLINDYCYKLSKSLMSASIYQFHAQLSFFNNEKSACYRCLYPVPPDPSLVPNCEIGGILGAVTGVVGALLASEVIKLILNKGTNLANQLLTIDLLTLCVRQFPVEKNKACSLCAKKEKSDMLFEANDCSSAEIPEISPLDLSILLRDKKEKVFLIDVRETFEREIACIESIHVPSGEFMPERIPFNREDFIVLYCKYGVRSKYCASILKASGYRNVYNLSGGIIAWANEIDSSMRTY